MLYIELIKKYRDCASAVEVVRLQDELMQQADADYKS